MPDFRKPKLGVGSHPVQDHFVEISKMVALGSGAKREIAG